MSQYKTRVCYLCVEYSTHARARAHTHKTQDKFLSDTIDTTECPRITRKALPTVTLPTRSPNEVSLPTREIKINRERGLNCRGFPVPRVRDNRWALFYLRGAAWKTTRAD